LDALELADNQAESGVVSTLVYHPEFILHSDYLKPGYFFNQDNGCIYWAISELYKKGIDNIDAFNISNMLASNKAVQNTINKYNLPSIQEYIDLCSETARHTLEEYKLLAQSVVTLSYKRDLVKSMSEVESFCRDKAITLSELNKKRNDVLTKLDEKYVVSDEIKILGDEAEDLWQEICERRTDNGYYGIPSMFKILNNWFTYEPTELVVVQAKYKQGKSVLLMLEALHKIKNGIPTLYVDREMSDRIFYERCLSALTGVDVKRIKNGRYSDEEREKIESANKWMKKQPFVHVYRPDLADEELYSMCKILKYKMGLQFVIDDYLKSNATSASDQYNLLGARTDFLKNRIAGELGLAVLTAAQLNRAGEVGDSMKINRYLSVGIKWFLKTQEQIAKDGLQCGNAGMKIYINRLGAQMPEDDENAYLDFIFDGNKMMISEAEQHDSTNEFD
jgi:replicative DNA helicase